MTNLPQDRPHTHYHKDHPHAPPAGPYWKRAHRDWKIWVMVAVMLGAMWIYLRTNDLSVQPSGKTQQPVP
jgi:hypothetical protein